jgi:hypothetical protein
MPRRHKRTRKHEGLNYTREPKQRLYNIFRCCRIAFEECQKDFVNEHRACKVIYDIIQRRRANGSSIKYLKAIFLEHARVMRRARLDAKQRYLPKMVRIMWEIERRAKTRWRRAKIKREARWGNLATSQVKEGATGLPCN